MWNLIYQLATLASLPYGFSALPIDVNTPEGHMVSLLIKQAETQTVKCSLFIRFHNEALIFMA